MEPGHYTDPLEEALSLGSRRVAEVASLAAAMTQVVIQRRALHDARTAARDDERAIRVLDEQEQLIDHQARLSWSPAHDARWLASADLPQTGRAWASAASFADADPLAASAMRKCEDRLRVLHPYAMARYDRLRTDGMSPLDAMQDTAPLFGRSPDVRVGDPVPAHLALTVSTGQEVTAPTAHPPGDAADPRPDMVTDENAEMRGRQIITRLQSNAQAAGRPGLGPDELAMVLEATTNLPHDVIHRIVRQPAAGDHPSIEPGLSAAAALTGVRSDRSAAQLAAESFPCDAADAVLAAPIARTTHGAGPGSAPRITERPGMQI